MYDLVIGYIMEVKHHIVMHPIIRKETMFESSLEYEYSIKYAITSGNP